MHQTSFEDFLILQLVFQSVFLIVSFIALYSYALTYQLNLYNLENASQIAEQERLTAEKQQEQADLKDQLLQLQLEEFDLKATEREEAATEREQADMAEAERNKKMNDLERKGSIFLQDYFNRIIKGEMNY